MERYLLIMIVKLGIKFIKKTTLCLTTNKKPCWLRNHHLIKWFMNKTQPQQNNISIMMNCLSADSMILFNDPFDIHQIL